MSDVQPEVVEVLDLDNPQTCMVCGKPAYRNTNENIWYHLDDRSHRVFRGKKWGVA